MSDNHKLFLLLALTGILLPSCQPLFQSNSTPTPATSTSAIEETNWDDFSIFKPGLIPFYQDKLERLTDANVYHIDYTINADFVSIDGTEDVRITNCEELILKEIQVRLLPNVLNGKMNVTSVKANDQPITPIYELQDSLLRIPLDNGLQPGERVILHFEFSVQVPTELESNYGILAFYDGVLTLAHTYLMVAVYDDEGWNAEIPPDFGDPVYAAASFFLVTVDAPKDVILAGSGREVERRENGSRQIVTFAAGPARDFYLAASPNYEVIHRTVGQITFNSYAPKDQSAGAKAALGFAEDAFRVFEERYAPYPYTEMDIISKPTYALGIEYPGIVAIRDELYALDGITFGMSNRTLMESVLVHEAGHQWFYNLVGNDQLDDPWLDESLVQFITWQYYADEYGTGAANGFEQSLRGRWARVENDSIPIGLPVADYTSTEYSAIVYGRGVFFFDALRDKLGDEHFNAFMQDYTETFSWDIGTPEGMKALAEKHCGCDLTDLFDQWVYP